MEKSRLGRIFVRFFLRLADLTFYLSVAYIVAVLLEIRNSGIIMPNAVEAISYSCLAGIVSAIADEVRSKHGKGGDL